MLLKLMTKRGSLIFALAFSFLLSAWGNVIAAAFCPRYLSNRTSHHKPISQESQEVGQMVSCHGMDNMEMTDMELGDGEIVDAETLDQQTPNDLQSEVDANTAQQAALDVPLEGCGHCWMHSQPASGTATLVGVDPAKQLVDTGAPPIDQSITVLNTFIVSVQPLDHGPPGHSVPRHVLINVFRI